ncbi:hypothetical protein CVS30_05920 [Arthrobacter psychrolactophilus]|uniref:DUF3800 domain-containing protein n=1 Tax=Arthrobacter psychrolactophilus TaxID=92442 RepID=A0A2V5IU19_9MICC|nr:DUF3800 domain-containing protein [Arthrobacter psychrolactophilus]PYI39481.1 hypothetical protein CVS30_05920 [Arthrobacter psychrolactophilus]
MTQQAAVAEIYFDESGHDGENLMAGKTLVFAHASIHMDLEEATDLVGYIRKLTQAQGPELKASDLMRSNEALKEDLFGAEGKLVGHAQVYLVEKANFAVGKIIDMLIEEEAHRRGYNIYGSGIAWQLADDLYQYGSRALTKEGWNDLLSSFTSLMRAKQRKGGDKETVDGFFEKVDNYRYKSRRKNVTNILEMLWITRQHADDFQAALAEGVATKALDPLQMSLYALASSWNERLQQPIMIMHDEQTALTKSLVDTLLAVAKDGYPESYNLPEARFPLVGFEHVDSKSDPRIQLADITAGFTRQVAEAALNGTAEDNRMEQIRSLVHINSIWGHSKSWEQIHPR